jgi:hypothetical protein
LSRRGRGGFTARSKDGHFVVVVVVVDDDDDNDEKL